MKLTSPSEIKKIVDEYKFPIRKKYGQNFLVDENILNKIVEAAMINQQASVLEIGPGLGTMTLALADQAKSVTTVEIDTMLIPILEKHFQEYSNISSFMAMH
jgi:16S rRNA (adenine1518-N6/adenine1519-N6)-dimethyltransferase